MNKSRVFQVLRLVALLGLATAVYAGPIYNFTHGFTTDIRQAVPDLAFLTILGGVVIALCGHRMGGAMVALFGAFVLVAADPIGNWLQSLAA